MWPYELLIGWRYTRASRRTRGNGFVSFISMISVVGIALGVAALIIVLSVMNGFQKEVRDRMLSVIAHVEVGNRTGEGLTPAQLAQITDEARRDPLVAGAAPVLNAQALLARGDSMKGVMVRAIDPAQEPQVTELGQQLSHTVFPALKPGGWGVLLGRELARSLQVQAGDTVQMLVPGGQTTPAGTLPRSRQMTVVGVFDAGHYEYDSGLAMMHLEDAKRLFRMDGPSAVQLKLSDLQQARAFSETLSDKLHKAYWISDWTRANPTWFAAVQIEKRMMGIILTLIVLVSAFNLVSTLVMTVTDKRADIAILRTLGASPRSVQAIFVVQGATAGVIGTLSGLVLGLLVAYNVDPIVGFIETLLRAKFLPPSLYLVSRMPSDPHASDIIPIVLVSLTLSFLATLYPSYRASRVQPAEALRYE